ncbi:MAG: gamma-glutamylcyclotransferase family protein [Balneolaceae bacterium]|nr:gamma-glutamylcyclotransferase family protein [Balneolaceae bacterium]
MTERTLNNYLFVYGSLRKAANHTAHNVLRDRAEFHADAVFYGALYLVKEYPAVVDQPDESSYPVKGEVYRLMEPTSVFASLDQYEGYYPYDPECSLYLRKLRPVELSDNSDQTLQAWIYLYNRPTGPLTQIPSGDYLEFIKGS